MFIHWGLYAQLGRGEWVMNRDRIPLDEYERLADRWRIAADPARAWVRLAKRAGMKYLVLTAKHCEGFCLWDSQLTSYTAARRGPRRDLVREYVAACRAEGLRVGLYYSLMDWHHPDGLRCASDAGARRRFLDYTQGQLRELMSGYGRIDLLFYDGAWPMKDDPAGWESVAMNAMIRRLQPGIIINDRSGTPQDYSTPEGRIAPAAPGRAWESCVTMNDNEWGWAERHAEDWITPRAILNLLRQVTAGQGNLLLNIGPKPDGSVPAEAVERLERVGAWLAANGEAVYGRVDRPRKRLEGWVSNGFWTLKGRTAYLWITRSYPGRELRLAGICTRLLRASLLATGASLPFTRTGREITIALPGRNPDRRNGMPVIKLEFAAPPRQKLGMYGRGRATETL